MTIFEAYNSIKQQLCRAGIEEYVFEAKQIIKFVTGYTNREILMNYADSLTDIRTERLEEIMRRRMQHYPLQYILGFWDFYGRRFVLGEGALIPRQDTETVVDLCLERLKDRSAPEILDLCAGTGCIGITLAAEVEGSRVTLVEKYPEPIKYLTENMKNHAPANTVLLKGDVFERTGADGRYDLIVSNPPYIKQEDMKTLQPEVGFEPEVALCGGEDGLSFYRFIAKEYLSSLKPDGIMVFETGYDEGEAVKDIMEAAGYADVAIKKDFSGNERVVFGTVK